MRRFDGAEIPDDTACRPRAIGTYFHQEQSHLFKVREELGPLKVHIFSILAPRLVGTFSQLHCLSFCEIIAIGCWLVETRVPGRQVGGSPALNSALDVLPQPFKTP